MAKTSTEIKWLRNDCKFSDNKYARAHQWIFDGGAVVPASSSPSIVPLPYSDASAVDPEEAFVVSIASCHMLWFLSIAAKQGFVVDSYTDSSIGLMGKNETGIIAMTEVELRPVIEWSGNQIPSAQQIDQMHEQAHHQCFIANSVKTNIRIITQPE